jgi:hypothetical protein
VRGLAKGGGSLSSGNEGLDLSLVGGVSNKDGELAVETFLWKLHDHVKLIPELLLIRLSRLGVSLKFAQTKSLHYALSTIKVFTLGEVTILGVDVCGEWGATIKVNEATESGGISLGDLALLN